MELFIYLFAALFSVLNPIGTVPIFVALTEGYTSAERAKVSLITSINVLMILLISFFNFVIKTGFNIIFSRFLLCIF